MTIILEHLVYAIVLAYTFFLQVFSKKLVFQRASSPTNRTILIHRKTVLTLSAVQSPAITRLTQHRSQASSP